MCVFSGQYNGLPKEEKAKMRKYSFNTEEDLKVGDVVESGSYNKPLTVAEVLDEVYGYYNVKTGELGKDNPSWEWKEIKLLTRK